MSEIRYIKNNEEFVVPKREPIDEVRRVPIWLLIPLALLMLLGGYLVMYCLGTETTGQIEYEATGKADYQVYLKENEYYSEKYLGAGKQYIANLIDTIRVDYEYKLEASENINANYTYEIVAIATATDRNDKSQILYEQADKLRETEIQPIENGTVEIRDNVNIDYNKYNEYMRGFRTDFGIAANCFINLKMLVKVDGAIKTEDTIAMNIPLSDQTISIGIDTKGLNREDKVGEAHKEIYIKNLPVLICGSVIMLASFVIGVILIHLYRTRFGNNWYAEGLNKIFRHFDTIIVNISGNFHEDGEVRRVDNFIELVDAANNEGAPILFCEVVPNYKAYFVVEGATTIYRYTFSRAYQDELRASGEKKERFW